jgi:hypothetical protein
MNKPAINRANFAYANDLRRRGYLTAVHALPKDYRDYIDERLAEGIGPKTIANDLISRYGDHIKTLGLKPISHMSIRGYRNKYWRKTPQFNRLVLEGSEASQKAINKVMNQFNSYREMVNMAIVQKRKAKLVDNIEEKTNLPSRLGNKSRKQFFKMAQVILEKEIELGLRPKVSLKINPTATTKTSLETEKDKKDLIRKGKEAIDALEGKGKYTKGLPTGEVLK